MTYFVVAFTSQILLLFPQFVALRIPLRMAPYLVAIFLSLFPPPNRRAGFKVYPAAGMAVLVITIIALGLFNQLTSSEMAGLAQIGLTAAILSPIVWVGRLQIGTRGLATIILCLWGFNALSAGVGVLQVLRPGQFQPATSSHTQELKEAGQELSIELADGTTIERPYGLTDQPGGAATGGLMAFVFGLGLLISTKRVYMQALYLAGMGVGLFVLYLCQVRAMVVMCGVSTIVFTLIMSARGELAKVTGILAALALVTFLSTSAAFVIGGDATRDRLLSLVADDASTVYQNNRGFFLEYTFYYVLPVYPLGAGLGRYGMMSHYFNNTADAESLWAEIQWTAWAYDGGWLMVVGYPIAILIAMWETFKIARNKVFGVVGIWAAILTSYNVAVVAVLFSYAFFLSDSGLEFWILNAACFSAAQVYLKSLTPDVPEGFEIIPAPWKPSIAPVVAPATESYPAQPRRRSLTGGIRPKTVPVFDQPRAAEGNM
jgi:hypothetical protein